MYINPKSKIFWHLDTLNDLKNGKTKAPINVEIDLTNRCNHGCDWCHFAYTHSKGPLANSLKPEGYIATGDQFDFELLKNVLRQLKAIGVKSVTWTGGGEPTLHPRFTDILELTYSIGLEQGLYTNGSFIDYNKAFFIKNLCKFVYVSLDECTPEDFKKSKGVTRFFNVLKGIELLVKEKGNCTVGLGFLLHEQNYQKIPKMIELGKTCNIDYIQFRPIINYDQDAPSKRIEFPKWIEELEYWPILRSDPEFILFDYDRFKEYLQWENHGYSTCNWTALQTVITPNGKVWSCVNKRGYEGALIGDLTVNTFEEIWSNYGVPCQVNSKCRVMCRGHLANQTLNELLTKPIHENFV